MFVLKVFIFSLLIFASTTFAYSPKEGNVTATLGSFFYRTHFPGSAPGVKSPLFGDFSFIANGDISDHGALEVTMFHMQKLFVREQGGSYLAEQTELIHITMGYRRWLNSFFSVSIAFFSSYAMGDPRVIHNNLPSGSELTTSAHDITEYGFDFSLQTEVWKNQFYSILVDTRYSRSVTAKVNENSDHYGALIALKYVVQEKERSSLKASH